MCVQFISRPILLQRSYMFTCLIDEWLTNMHHFICFLKLCNPNGWKSYMQLKYINLKSILKYFLSAVNKSLSSKMDYVHVFISDSFLIRRICQKACDPGLTSHLCSNLSVTSEDKPSERSDHAHAFREEYSRLYCPRPGGFLFSFFCISPWMLCDVFPADDFMFFYHQEDAFIQQILKLVELLNWPFIVI